MQSNNRSPLPLLSDKIFLTDGGMETWLVFHRGVELRYFAAFDLLKDEQGWRVLEHYYRQHASIAMSNGIGFILETPTWRASRDWGCKIGYSDTGLSRVNRDAVRRLSILRQELESDQTPMLISGCVGPRGDGYQPGRLMSADEAAAYHDFQIKILADTEADVLTAMTMTNVPEALGIVQVAQRHEMPVVISFTVETDGRLPSGDTLGNAITAIDEVTGSGPRYYMINCAHPTHFCDVLPREPWVQRLKGVRVNASMCSHAELDEAEALDDGDPVALGRQVAELRRQFPNLNVLGGCCGTDHRHIEEIARAVIHGGPRRLKLPVQAAE